MKTSHSNGLNEPFSEGKAIMFYTKTQLTNRMDSAIRPKMEKWISATPFLALALSGCIQVEAPDKPIEINLNISIRSDVVLRLGEASQKVTEENPEIF